MHQTKIRQVREEVAELKSKFANLNIRHKDGGCNLIIINSIPWENKRSRGKQIFNIKYFDYIFQSA